MPKLHAPLCACFVLLLAACSGRDKPASAETPIAAAEPAAAPAVALTPGAPNARIDRIDLPVAAPAGPPGPLSAKTMALKPEAIERAIVAELGDGATGIDVSVDRGIVHLSGDVKSEADFQRANYVARALDGVIEVDQSQMRVAR